MPPKKSSSRKIKPKAKANLPSSTLLDAWQQTDEWLLKLYSAYRKRLPLDQRLGELLRSCYFRHQQLPANQKQAQALEDQYGDGCLDERRELQAHALAHCKTLKISQSKICDIGERARDLQRRLDMTSELLPLARKWNEDTQEVREWARRGELHVVPKVAARTTGLVEDPAGRLRTILQELQQFCDGGDGMLPQFDYRHPKAGRRIAEGTKLAARELRALGVSAQFSDFFLMAWSLKPLSDKDQAH